MEARANSKFRRQKDVMNSPEPIKKKKKNDTINKFGVEDNSFHLLKPTIQHSDGNDVSNVGLKIELIDINKRESIMLETSGELTDRGSNGNQLGQSTFSLLQNDVNHTNSIGNSSPPENRTFYHNEENN